MALTPISAGCLISPMSLANSSRNVANKAPASISGQDESVHSIDESIKKAKNSSLLYQVVSKLLLDTEQSEQLNTQLEDIESLSVQQSNLNVEEFQISISQQAVSIEFSRFELQQQRITFNDGQTIIEIDAIIVSGETIQLRSNQPAPEQADPLILDLNGDGISTTGIEYGAYFDLNNDGTLNQMSTVADDNVFLALDINNNGTIDNGSELFGDQTGHANGFEALKTYDDNQDNVIDQQDSVYNRLLTARLIGNEQFIQNLSETGIKEINLNYSQISESTESGDNIVQLSEYRNKDNENHSIVDVMLAYRETSQNQE